MDRNYVIKRLEKIQGEELEPSNAAEMVEDLKGNKWKISTQEFYHLEKNPENFYDYLKFRYSFYKSNNRPDFNTVSPFPIYLVVEPTSICNYRCVMCWQHGEEIRKAPYAGTMDFSVFKKIVDEAHEKGCKAMTIAGRGEPLINPAICDFLYYAKDKFYELKINTNGSLLNEEICRAILEANVALLVFSAEGTNQREYEKTRVGGNLQQVVNNIHLFNRIKKQYYPQSRTQTRVSGIIVDKVDEDKYYQFWEKVVDEVTLEYAEERNDIYSNKKQQCDMACYRLWQRMYIWWDGSCSPCDNDYLQKLNIAGNIRETSIQEIWHGSDFNRIRNIHKKNREGIIPCDRCGI